MKRNQGFDEVMIVNPYEPGSNANQGARFMRFYAAPPGMGYYAEPADHYGYYAEPADHYGYYAEPADHYGYYAEPADHYGYYAAPADGYGCYANLPEQYVGAEPVGYVAGHMGYYGDPYAMGGYGAYEPMGYYGYYGEPAPMEGYYGEPAPMEGYYGEAGPMEGYYGYTPMGYYAEGHEAPGYSQYAPLAENHPEMGGYGAYGAGYGEGYAGYVRETEPRYNAGCPMPTNVHGFGESGAVDGYVRPSTVNPTCDHLTPQPGQHGGLPDSFKPLW